MIVKRIRLHGQDFIMTPDGAITTPDDFRDFKATYAQFYSDDDVISRLGTAIGTGADIEYLGEMEHPGPSGLGALFANLDSWLES